MDSCTEGDCDMKMVNRALHRSESGTTDIANQKEVGVEMAHWDYAQPDLGDFTGGTCERRDGLRPVRRGGCHS